MSAVASTEDFSVVGAPAGMREVSRDEFWRAVMRETRNISPSPEQFHTDWRFVGTAKAWGWVSHGFATAHDAPPARYALARTGGAQ